MLKNILFIGRSLSITEMKNIGGRWQDTLDDEFCRNFDSDTSFDPRCDSDRDGRECRYPYYVNSFGRCTL